MMSFIVLLLLVAVTATGLASKRWLTGRLLRLKDHSKKEELEANNVEIVVQEPGSERHLKLALPDVSSNQIRSPVGPMTSSIQCASKDFRSRQTVRSLCNKFESCLTLPNVTKASVEENTKKLTAATAPLMKAHRRGEWNATVAPSLLANQVGSEAKTASARSNNLNKFLRTYASNLDRAISTGRGFYMASCTLPVKKSEPLRADADSDKQPLLEERVNADEITSNGITYSDDLGIKQELELRTCSLQLEAEFSNQSDWSPTSDGDGEGFDPLNATDCEPIIKEKSLKIDRENNHVVSKRGFARFSRAFSLDFSILEDVRKPNSTNNDENQA